MNTRRWLLGTLALAPFVGEPAVAQSATAEALDDFARYIDAAASIFSELALGLRNADARDIRGPDARRALDEVQSALRDQAVANGAVVNELSEYYNYARSTSAEPDVRGRLWSLALRQVSETSAVVRRVAGIVGESTVLRRVLSDDQQVALRDTLAMREQILGRLRELPAPATTDELNRLNRFIVRYGQLIEALRRIRVALNAALED